MTVKKSNDSSTMEISLKGWLKLSRTDRQNCPNTLLKRNLNLN
jgi:hypothetical protein